MMERQLQLGENRDHLPLAARLRPRRLTDMAGQDHLIGPGKPLSRLLERKKIPSLILWGPPGCGKTSLARLIATEIGAHFKELSAVLASVRDVKQELDQAREILQATRIATILFIDEIHRFNKSQQSLLLPAVENGSIIFIASTTENPAFSVITPLRSRCQLFSLKALPGAIIEQRLREAADSRLMNSLVRDIRLAPAALSQIARFSNGDLRMAYNFLEAACYSAEAAVHDQDLTQPLMIEQDLIESLLERGSAGVVSDKAGDAHYDHASAFQKSMRGSDVNATIYYLAKMISHGEDPRFIARRMIVCAAEDVGLRDPFALTLALAAADAAERLGLPEARIPLVEAAIYIARAPKSNATIRAIDAALADIQQHGRNYPVPLSLRSTGYAEASQYGHGQGYLYSHEHRHEPQRFLPEELAGVVYYAGEEELNREEGRKRSPLEYPVEPAHLEKIFAWLQQQSASAGPSGGETPDESCPWQLLDSEILSEQLLLPKQEIKRAIMELVRQKRLELKLKTYCRLSGSRED